MRALDFIIRDELVKEGAALVGFADISELPRYIRRSMDYSVSIAVKLDAGIIEEIADGPTESYYQEYMRVNKLLEKLGRRAGEILKGEKKNSVVIRPSVSKDELDRKTLATLLPHKMVATRAGLGWIGKSALLITKEYGPAVRLASVLTDAEFEEVGRPVNSSQCGECRKCVDSCPVKAIVGENWQVGMQRGAIYDAFRCFERAKVVSQAIGSAAPICGICINACPWTQKYIRSTGGGV